MKTAQQVWNDRLKTLQDRRAKMLLSYDALAEKAEVGRGAVIRVFMGYVQPSMPTYIRLCKALEIEPFP